jgi:hypothetical protein
MPGPKIILLLLNLVLSIISGYRTYDWGYQAGLTDGLQIIGLLWLILFFISFWSLLLLINELIQAKKASKILNSLWKKPVEIVFWGLITFLVINILLIIPHQQGVLTQFRKNKSWMDKKRVSVIEDMKVNNNKEKARYFYGSDPEGNRVRQIFAGYIEGEGYWVEFETGPHRGFYYFEKAEISLSDLQYHLRKIEPHWYRNEGY